MYTLRYLFYIINGGFLSLIIIYYIKNVDTLKSIFKKITIVIIIEMIICLLEILTDFRWPISPYSEYIGYFGRTGTDMVNLNPVIKKILLTMPTGFQWNPNNLATKITIVLPFFLFLKNKWIKYTGLIVCIFIIVMSSSRGNLIALFIVFLLYFILYYKALAKKILFCLTIILAFCLLITIPFLREKLETTFQLLEIINNYATAISNNNQPLNSVSIRGLLIRNGLNALVQSNFVGVGGGASNYVQTIFMRGRTGIISMHNFWIEILVEGGVIFFLIFVLWCFMIFFKLYRIQRITQNKDLKYFASSCSLALAGFSMGGISASTVIYFLPMWFLFGVAIAVINLHYTDTRNQEIPGSPDHDLIPGKDKIS